MSVETITRFACFGGTCAIVVSGYGPAGAPDLAVARAQRRMEAWHRQFSRFDARSELSRLNRDPRSTVPVSAMMARFVESALWTATRSDGLVDPTLVAELEHAGYATSFVGPALPLGLALATAPARAPAGPDPRQAYREVSVDRLGRTVTRPPGVQIDSGGVAKGLFGDILAGVLGAHDSFAVNACGDIRLGGRGGHLREIDIADPFEDGILHTFELARGAVATSGIGHRSWLDHEARPAHHLLDPRTGRAAFTGVVQVSALAPTGREAELRAKAALLSGPDGARHWLPHGGLLVLDSGAAEVLAPDPWLLGSCAFDEAVTG